MDLKAHWEQLYRTKGPDQLSWFESEATLSVSLLQRVAPTRDESIIDVGAGSANFVDGLLNAGYHRVTVLDLAAAALMQAKGRLQDRAHVVNWCEANVLTAQLPAKAFDIWHDRAVFHFLTKRSDIAPDCTGLQYCIEIPRKLVPTGEFIKLIQRNYVTPGGHRGSDPMKILNPIAIALDGTTRP